MELRVKTHYLLLVSQAGLLTPAEEESGHHPSYA